MGGKQGLFVHPVGIAYNHCNYHYRAGNRKHPTREVLVTNYQPDGFTQDTLF
ncbi:hypothetical protein BAAM0499_03840 [Bifidobacterium animalis subsp. animalis MCC 0499]|nr:hypothetical protein BAAM0499_03840 [Bifidobacterium animalis subsp. animalis MCC 0499]